MWKFTNKYVPNNTYGKISKFSRNNISGAVISYVSERQRRFQELNFATSLPFRILKS